MGEIPFIMGLIVLGIVCFTLEIITPSFGILAVAGLAAMVWAIVEAFGVSPIFGWVLVPSLLVGTLAYLRFMVKALPNSKLAGKIILGASVHSEGDAAPNSRKHAHLVGKTGTAETTLRPSGTVRVDGQRYDATAEAEMIARGTAIKVLRSRGSNIVVTPVTEPVQPENGNAEPPPSSDEPEGTK